MQVLRELGGAVNTPALAPIDRTRPGAGRGGRTGRGSGQCCDTLSPSVRGMLVYRGSW